MNWLEKAQNYLRDTKRDAWIVYDFQLSNPIARYLLGYRPSATRRYFIVVREGGMPVVIASIIDQFQFTSDRFNRIFYKNHDELREALKQCVGDVKNVYLDYSHNCDIPHMSKIDLGTVEFLRSLNASMTIHSSADIFQYAMATWSPSSLQKHLSASEIVEEIKTAAFDRIFTSIDKGDKITEYDVQQFIMDSFSANGLVTDSAPCVSVNSNSARSHYEPTKDKSEIIKTGDWLLLDLWARHKEPDAVYADITWVGYVGATRDMPARYGDIFAIVKGARDNAVQFLKTNVKNGIEGWQVDKVARDHIAGAGYGEFFKHRTGHSMAPGEMLHALSVNLDNYETKDTRKILPGVGFSIEPGIYLDEFGVRLEINAYVSEQGELQVTSCVQDSIVTMDNRR